MTSSTQNTPQALIARYLSDHAASWSLGTFGAIAEFMFDDGEVLRKTEMPLSVATDRGAIRISLTDAVRPIAYETMSSHADSWNHAVALCLPEDACAMTRRAVLTELGPDRDAIRPEDREAILFDLGLDCLQIDACVRTADPEAIAILRSGVGRPLLEPGNPAAPAMPRLSPHRVFICRFGRVEVFQPIPAPGGKSPDGPHTHLLPKLLAHGRTHAATNPIPEGWIPCMHLFPPHPQKDQMGMRRPFSPDLHAEFQQVLNRYGVAELVAVKGAVKTAVTSQLSASAFDAPESREGRTALRIALRQLAVANQKALPDWQARFDRVPETAAADEAIGGHD